MAAVRERSNGALLSLPHDILLSIAENLVPSSLPTAMALLATCRLCREILQPVRGLAEQRRLSWQTELSTGHVVTNSGRTLTRLGGKWTRAWAVGPLLPCSGRVTWRMKIDRCAENEGVMCIGVCDGEGRHAYGLAPYSGTLSSLHAAKLGAVVTANACAPPQHQQCTFTKQLMESPSGAPTSLKGRAVGSQLEITYDADRGDVHFRINRGPSVCAISGLPLGAQLRPWARLFDVADRVSCSGFWTAVG